MEVVMIVVTGMHRSGTSAISMLLEGLGLDFGDHAEFYAADRWNEHGYFERRDVIDLNSRLLTGFPRTKGQPESSLAQIRYILGPSSAAVGRRAERLRGEVTQLASHLDGLAVKDPRFCLTMPVWGDFTTHLVVCLRHPAAVARSLRRRQRIPEPIALRFWNRHAEGVLAATEASTVYVDFDALGGDHAEAELARMISGLGLEVAADAAATHLQNRFASELRHFQEGAEEDLPAHTRRLWLQLQDRHQDQVVR